MGTGLITIRSMVANDLDAVFELEEAEQVAPWSLAMFRQELAGHNRDYIVAEVDDRIIGFAGLMTIGDEGHVNTLLVDGSHRRLGVAKALMQNLIGIAIQRGARHLTLEVRSRNESARRFYSKLGFAPVGVRPNYYQDDDALIMWLHDVEQRRHLERIQ